MTLGLASALTACALDALKASADKLIRIESLFGQDASDLIDELDPQKRFRFGLTGRSKKLHLGRTKGVSSSASELTKWRNESLARRTASPIILIGDASGREEAGLRKTPVILTESIVLAQWRRLVDKELSKFSSKQPRGFALALIDMASAGLIDPNELSAFIEEFFKSEKIATEKPQMNLWQLGLIPDPRAMDSVTPGVRLSKNYATSEFLREPPDSKKDDRDTDQQ